MSEPAKDEAELVERIARDFWEVAFGQKSKWNERWYLADAAKALAAIRAAGWVVVPVAEQDALRAENARLGEALEIVAAGLNTFAINPVGGPDIVVGGGSRFAHERDVLPMIHAARAALEVKP